MFRLWSRDQSIEATLKQIEHRVLNEVYVPLWARRVARVAATVLIVTGITAWAMGHDDGGVPLAASVLGAGAAICSAVSLRRHRFGWCVAAAYLSGVSTVVGIGAFWWCRTGSAGPILTTSTGASAVAAAALTAVWVSVAITPVKDSHPDMRQPLKRKWGVRESGATIIWPPPCARPHRPDRK
ncbi:MULTISPECIES: hypothetical protein [Mycolicibacterium]|uniref:hypothetical protein n=1 Tax=Mycolicibacterium TaxID=1866885 RepID=UPI000CF84D75|nr:MULTISPECIES: hypothetical protein [Mycolicibacterium]PQP48028.1 hypothetical protein C6A88_14850 [Mycolicibacterium austroafricanum]UJL27370.1 hypothetical protein HZU38_20915 [Mycolicibacterium vanbaalenii]WND59506.1 hypothetical protein QQA43_14530 [Mycolicibacterium vanbaalenii]